MAINNSKSYLSIVFIYHNDDENELKPILEYCASQLSRDVKKPFSRSVNLPIFYFPISDSIEQFDSSYINSSKIIVFPFVTNNLYIADERIMHWIDEFSNREGSVIIPVAMEEDVYDIQSDFRNNGFIRYTKEETYRKENIFIQIAHEIYRHGLNDSDDEKAPLKIFISYANDDYAKPLQSGKELAVKLKNFISNTVMKCFFDLTDLAPGNLFGPEILENIKESSIIAIHSDIYSSRYWCQREIQTAKKTKRPILAVNILNIYDDRSFPYITNIPELRIMLHNNDEQKVLLDILSGILIETIRFRYTQHTLEQFRETLPEKDETLICCRPPEFTDVSISGEINNLLYPDPPVYPEELEYFEQFHLKVFTPLTYAREKQKESNREKPINVGISISNPSDDDLTKIGLTKEHLQKLSQEISWYLLGYGYTLIYGGDLRPDGFTEFLFEEAKILKSRLNEMSKQSNTGIRLVNYLSWPIYLKDVQKVKEWKKKYKDVADFILVESAPEVEKMEINKKIFLPRNTPENCYFWSKCLTKMRIQMIENCNVRICAGGKQKDIKVLIPGVLEEFLMALEQECHIFLLGGYGGITASICNVIENKERIRGKIQDGKVWKTEIPEDLMEEWYYKTSNGYQNLVQIFNSQDGEESVKGFEYIVKKVIDANLNNGLSKEDNLLLFHTPFADEAIFLILKGLSHLS